MQTPRSEPDGKPLTGLDGSFAGAVDKWAEPDGPAPPRPKNRIVRIGMVICACGFALAILGVAQLAEQKNHATALAHFTHKAGLLTMFTGFTAMLLGFRDSRFRARTSKSSDQPPIRDAMGHPVNSDWRDKPWRTS